VAAPEPLFISSQAFGSIEAQHLWFWRVVQQTLETVFHEKGAASIVSDYRREVDREASGLEQIALYHSSPLSVAADLADSTDTIPHPALEIYLKIQHEAVQYFGLSTERTRSPGRLSFVDGRASQASIRLMNQLSSLVQTSSLPTRSSTPCSRFGLSLTSMTTIAPSVSLMSTP
jgi:hypothetical protein